MPMRDVGSTAWDAEVLNSSQPVLVEFWAPWCPWCRRLTPELDALSDEYEGRLTFLKLNTEEHGDVAQRYGIMGLPTVKFFCRGREVGELIGYMPRPKLKTQLDSMLASHKDCLEQSSPLKK